MDDALLCCYDGCQHALHSLRIVLWVCQLIRLTDILIHQLNSSPPNKLEVGSKIVIKLQLTGWLSFTSGIKVEHH